jgi:hypothetical protein
MYDDVSQYNFNQYPMSANIREAAHWLQEAAKNGHLDAMWRLGLKYEFGYFVDITQRIDWLLRAAEKRHFRAINELNYLQLCDFPKALSWLHEAANAGYLEAMYVLGSHYFKSGSSRALLASHWFQKASDLGHLRARCILGRMLIAGGVTIDVETGARLLESVVQEGNRSTDPLDVMYCVSHTAQQFIERHEQRKRSVHQSACERWHAAAAEVETAAVAEVETAAAVAEVETGSLVTDPIVAPPAVGSRSTELADLLASASTTYDTLHEAFVRLHRCVSVDVKAAARKRLRLMRKQTPNQTSAAVDDAGLSAVDNTIEAAEAALRLATEAAEALHLATEAAEALHLATEATEALRLDVDAGISRAIAPCPQCGRVCADYAAMDAHFAQEHDNDVSTAPDVAPPPPASDDVECSVCVDASATHAYVPCGHKCVCEPCSARWPGECPLCRMTAERTIRIYI